VPDPAGDSFQNGTKDVIARVGEVQPRNHATSQSVVERRTLAAEVRQANQAACSRRDTRCRSEQRARITLRQIARQLVLKTSG
jgi:hypothetical protein